jgi:hypothetical protein
MNLPLMRPTRTAPSGPSHGMSLTISAALAPMMLKDIGIVFAVGAQQDALHLDFVIPAFGKERADGAVGQTAGEDFFFRGTAFALEVAAGKFAGGGRLFAVIHGQREKVLAFLGLGGGHGGHDGRWFRPVGR